MKKLLQLCSFLLLVGGSLPALAATCTTPGISAPFGGVSSFTVNTTASTVTTTANVSCGSGTLVLLANDYISLQLTGATATVGNRGAMRLADSIPVQLCTDQNCATELAIGGTSVIYNRNQLLGLNLGTGTQIIFGIPLYLRTVPGAVVAAGTYTVQLNLGVTANICAGLVGIGNICLGTTYTGTTNLPITATITISNDCTTITAPAVNFGSAPLVSNFNTVSQSINVICTKGSTYTVGMNNGIHAGSGTQRYMTSGGNQLAYEIYKGSGTTRWGSTVTSERVPSSSATNTSLDGLTRTFTYNARVLTTQNTPVAGSYSDTVTVDLSF